MFAELIPRADFLFRMFGGYKEASLYIEDELLTNVCMFGGTTLVLTKFTEPFRDIDLPIPSVDLATLGYRLNTKYQLFNSDNVLLFEQVIQPLELNAQSQFIFGLNTIERELLDSSDHGSVYYIRFNSEKGPVLLQLLVCSKAHPQDYIDFIKDIRLEDNTTPDRYNSILLYKKNDISSNVAYLLPGLESSNYTYNQVVYDSRTELVPFSSEIYIKPTKSTWMVFRQYLDDVEVNISTGDNLLEVELSLLNSGYTRINTNYWTSGINNSHIEVYIEFESDVVTFVRARSFTNLLALDITGQNKQQFKNTTDYVYFLDLLSPALPDYNSQLIKTTSLGRSLSNRRVEVIGCLSINNPNAVAPEPIEPPPTDPPAGGGSEDPPPIDPDLVISS